MDVNRIISSLPEETKFLLKKHRAPQRLRVHLQLVYITSKTIVAKLVTNWPSLNINRELVLFGASIHDIGKVSFPQELVEPGTRHEQAGYDLLLKSGIDPERARFAYTHGVHPQSTEINLEDLLVMLADKVWKGKRFEELEQLLTTKLSEMLTVPEWEIYERLDSMIVEIAQNADEDICYQNSFPVT